MDFWNKDIVKKRKVIRFKIIIYIRKETRLRI